MIKTFRGQLEDGGQDHIRLQTIKGKVGYRIAKFQIMGPEPGEQHMEHTVKIYKDEQSTINNTVNFSSSSFLGVAYLQDNHALGEISSMDIIFDREVFNQDIFVTHVDTQGSEPCNYYLELEVVRLTDSDAELTTLKDIRGRNTTP